MITHAWVIPILPLAAAALVALLGRRVTKIAGSITASAVFFALIISLKLFTILLADPGIKQVSIPWIESSGNLLLEAGMLIDPLSVMMLVIVTFISLLVQVYSLGYMADDPDKPRYFAYLSLFTFSMIGLVMANNLVMIYMFWELVGLSSYLLIGFWYQKPEAANAGKKAFIVTRFGDLGFLIAILLIGFLLNTFNVIEVGKAASAGKLSGDMATLVALLIFAGAAGKSAQFPLHIWLPDAMEGPTPVSALIHAATMVAAGVFLVARIYPVFQASEAAMLVVAYIGGFTAIFAASIGCVQNDIKRILAFSTISQLGYMMMALGCGGYQAGLFHLMTHAAFKALLFLGAGSVIHAVHTNNIWEMGGLLRRMGITGTTMLIAALALAGVFPFSGFFSKDAILFAAYDAGRIDLLVIGLVTALLTSFYIFRMFFIVFTGKPAKGHIGHESPLSMILPLLGLGVLSIGLGFFHHAFGQFIANAYGAVKEIPGHHNRLIPMFAFVAAVFGFGWAYLVYAQKAVSAALLERRFQWIHTVLSQKYYIDEIYLFFVRHIMFALSGMMAWFDRHVIDGAVDGIAWLCKIGGDGMRRLQVGRLHAYVLAFFVGVIVILVTLLIANSDVMALLP